MNPVFSALGNGGSGLPAPFNNMTNFMNKFNQFRSSFQGDPKQKVQELLNSGQMSQQQFNQLQALASQIQKSFK